jgi:hypothetical protein
MTERATSESRQFLRHTLATLAYRCGKALRNAPEGFVDFRIGETTRTPGQILAHIGDLLDWALTTAQGNEKWKNSEVLPWAQGTARFFAACEALDAYLASDTPLGKSTEILFQAPIADALTHVGQIAMLRRMAGSPVKGEDYSGAAIVAGRVGAEQSAPKFEFD